MASDAIQKTPSANQNPSILTKGEAMAPRKSKPRQSQTPPQTTFIEPVPQVKNSDILDVDEAAILANVAHKASVQRSC
jgi:hypothetical protein